MVVGEMSGLYFLVHQHGGVDVGSPGHVSYHDYSCHDQLLGFVNGNSVNVELRSTGTPAGSGVPCWVGLDREQGRTPRRAAPRAFAASRLHENAARVRTCPTPARSRRVVS